MAPIALNAKAAWLALTSVIAAGAATGAAHAAPSGLTGLWLLDQHTFDRQMTLSLPLTAGFKAEQDAVAKAMAEGKLVLSDHSRKCLPLGMPGLMVNEFALEILETPGRVTMVSEASTLARTISLSRKAHIADQDPSWNGDAIGHWEGPTLVVETVNLNDRVTHFPLGYGDIRSTGVKITERLHLTDGGATLVDAMTFEDARVLTRPWTISYTYHRAEGDAELWEYVCETDAPGWSERFKDDPDFKAAPGTAPP